MEGHRIRQLILRAHVDGVIDFRNTDLLNPNWHKRLLLVLKELVDREKMEILKLIHQRELAKISIPLLTTEGLESSLELAQEALESYVGILVGRGAQDKETRKTQQIKTLEAAWASQFGDPNDPETQEAIDRVVSALKVDTQED